jgi:glycosyltransferase involved in cell wall biosynthesis
VIVVDDLSTDNTPEIVARYGARCLRTEANIGPGGARNLGVQHARGEIVVFVDSDVVLPRNALALIATEFRRDPELAALFGSYDDAPAWNDFLSQYKNLMHHYVHQTSSEKAVTFWAGCGAVRKSIFQEFGGFNVEKYPDPSIEDIEFGYRLSMGGHRIRLNKQVQVKHLKKWTLRGLLRADIRLRAIPWSRLILETRNLPRDLNLTPGAQISSLLVGVLVLLLGLLPLAAWDVFPWVSAGTILLAAGAVVAVLLVLNRRVYSWFVGKRGVWFTAGAVLAHWAYYFYSGVAFAWCAASHLVRSFFESFRREGKVSPAKSGE